MGPVFCIPVPNAHKIRNFIQRPIKCDIFWFFMERPTPSSIEFFAHFIVALSNGFTLWSEFAPSKTQFQWQYRCEWLKCAWLWFVSLHHVFELFTNSMYDAAKLCGDRTESIESKERRMRRMEKTKQNEKAEKKNTTQWNERDEIVCADERDGRTRKWTNEWTNGMVGSWVRSAGNLSSDCVCSWLSSSSSSMFSRHQMFACDGDSQTRFVLDGWVPSPSSFIACKSKFIARRTDTRPIAAQKKKATEAAMPVHVNEETNAQRRPRQSLVSAKRHTRQRRNISTTKDINYERTTYE